MKPTELIWLNGEFVKWEDATIHVLTHGLHYGTGVFEGVRCYDTEVGPAVFRHVEHLDRLRRPAIPAPLQPKSLVAMVVTCLPWKLAMPSSTSLGTRSPLPPLMVEAP